MWSPVIHGNKRRELATFSHSKAFNMKLVWLVLMKIFAVSSASSDASGDCENWPTQQEDFKKCCTIPCHENNTISPLCQETCSTEDRTINYECFITCYVNHTGLLKNGKVNKTLIKEMYAKNVHSYRWLDIIPTEVDKCELESSGSMAANLLKYFKCIDAHFVAKCVTFRMSVECDAVELRIEICRAIAAKYNCTSWPTDIEYPNICCIEPKLVNPDLTETCTNQCRENEIFDFREDECIENCTWAGIDITASDGTFDCVKVKNALMRNSRKSANWEKSIEHAVDTCQKMSPEGKSELNLFVNFNFNVVLSTFETRHGKHLCSVYEYQNFKRKSTCKMPLSKSHWKLCRI